MREYGSSRRCVELVCIPEGIEPAEDDERPEVITLQELRDIVAATSDYRGDALVRVFRPVECEDDMGRTYWPNGLLVEETTPNDELRGSIT